MNTICRESDGSIAGATVTGAEGTGNDTSASAAKDAAGTVAGCRCRPLSSSAPVIAAATGAALALPPRREAAKDVTSSLSMQVDVGSAVVLTPPTRE